MKVAHDMDDTGEWMRVLSFTSPTPIYEIWHSIFLQLFTCRHLCNSPTTYIYTPYGPA